MSRPTPIDPPPRPQPGLRVFALRKDEHAEDANPIGVWCLGRCYTVTRVNGRSFYVYSDGSSERRLLVEWHQWLWGVQDSCWTWILWSEDDPRGWCRLRPAPLDPLALAEQQATRTGPSAKEQRFLRARHEVLGSYRFERADGSEGTTLVTVEGGARPYCVALNRGWTEPPACDCPDAVHRRAEHGGYCKHAVAVLLRWPDLRAQLLSAIL